MDRERGSVLLLFPAAILVVILLLLQVVNLGKGTTQSIGFSDFLDKVGKQEIERVEWRGETVQQPFSQLLGQIRPTSGSIQTQHRE